MEVIDIRHAILEDTSTVMSDTVKDNVLLIESFEEFLDQLNLLYTTVFRLYTNFKKDTRYVWIGPDSQLKWPTRLLGKDRIFLDRWRLPRWEKVKQEIKFNCNRRLVVKEEWILSYRDELISRDII